MKHRYFNRVAVAACLFAFAAVPTLTNAQVKPKATKAGETCIASPKPGAIGGGPHNGPSVGDYSLFATVRKATDAKDCESACEFTVKYEIGYWDGNGWTEAPPGSDAYNAWHPDTGQYAGANIHWDYGDSTTTNNFSKSKYDYSLECGTSQVVYAEVCTNSPIPPSPATNPGAAPQIVCISVTVDLACGDCKRDQKPVDGGSLQGPHKTGSTTADGYEDALAMSIVSGQGGWQWIHVTGANGLQETGYQLRIFNLSGQQMAAQRGVLGTETRQRIAMQATNLPAGLYVAQLELSNGRTLTKRFIAAGH